MPAFARLFDPSAVRLEGERLITLPDRYLAQPPPARVPRYENASLWLMDLRGANAGNAFAVRWPAIGTARAVDLAAADAAALGVTELIEFAALPFAIAPTLRALPDGAPTFYLGMAAAALNEHTLLQPSDPPLSVTQLWLGVVFQDRLARASWAWIEAIGDALAATAPGDAPAWRSMATLPGAARAIHVLDVQGRPHANAPFEATFVDPSGTVIETRQMNTDAQGRLGAAAMPPAGAQLRLRSRAGALPLLAHYEGALSGATASAIPNADGSPSPPLALPAGFTRGHVQFADVDAWLAPVTPAPPAGRTRPARFRARSELVPLVDGHAVFADLVPAIRATNVPEGGVYLMDWAILDFEMIPGDPGSTIVKLMDHIRQHGDARILATRMFQPKASTIETISTDAAFLLLFMHMVGQPAMAFSRLDSSSRGRLLFASAMVAATIAYIKYLQPGGAVEEKLRKLIEETSDETLEALNAHSTIAHRSAHPASFADNPLFEDILLPDGHHLSDLQDRFSVFHNKVQLVKRTPSALERAANDNFEYVAYLGGIDVNTNRLDAPGHHGAGYREPESPAPPRAAPYHDVHARVGGEAVVDAFGVFEDRFAFDVPPVPADPSTRLPFPTPDPSIFAAYPGEHLVQVSQTEFRASDPTRGFPWAREGNRTNIETFVRAIAAARDYIYIEDQYLVPDDRYIHALVAASQHCKRLVILALSSIGDIPFGEDRRLAMFQRLAAPEAWGDRVLIGSPHRRPVLDPADRTASIGRLTLVDDVTAGDTAILVAPPARVPEDARFFFWINGELMFALGSTNVTDPEGLPAAKLEVIRGGVGSEPRWCPHPRAHKKGSPVTAAHPLPIYVHAKIMMVDDVFVGIGSMNINRRGFYHDGEMVASALPVKLAAARDNPARKLRVALWAEHLGIDPAMGEALLGDPMAAFELFRRSRYQGNRFTLFREFLVPHAGTHLPKMLEGILGKPAYIALELLVQSFLLANRTKLYNTISDPTTSVDPDPEPGPEID